MIAFPLSSLRQLEIDVIDHLNLLGRHAPHFSMYIGSVAALRRTPFTLAPRRKLDVGGRPTVDLLHVLVILRGIHSTAKSSCMHIYGSS